MGIDKLTSPVRYAFVSTRFRIACVVRIRPDHPRPSAIWRVVELLLVVELQGGEIMKCIVGGDD